MATSTARVLATSCPALGRRKRTAGGRRVGRELCLSLPGRESRPLRTIGQAQVAVEIGLQNPMCGVRLYTCLAGQVCLQEAKGKRQSPKMGEPA